VELMPFDERTLAAQARRVLRALLTHPGASAEQLAAILDYTVSRVLFLLRERLDGKVLRLADESTRTPIDTPKGRWYLKRTPKALKPLNNYPRCHE
jgi:hypothetical protein